MLSTVFSILHVLTIIFHNNPKGYCNDLILEMRKLRPDLLNKTPNITAVSGRTG